jgi:hypothetical protein
LEFQEHYSTPSFEYRQNPHNRGLDYSSAHG